jgi:hypothetical protein
MRVRAGKAMKVRELIEFIGRGYLQTLKIATLMWKQTPCPVPMPIKSAQPTPDSTVAATPWRIRWLGQAMPWARVTSRNCSG